MSDLISRQDALDCLSRGEGCGHICRNRIKSLPSAEPKTGEWTNVGVLTVRCSNCKSEFHELEAMNYCPNCGADMRGVDK